jgi:hypothetical protein
MKSHTASSKTREKRRSKKATNLKKKTKDKHFLKGFQDLKINEDLLQNIEAKVEEIEAGDLVVIIAPKDFTQQQLRDLELIMKMLSDRLNATILVLPEGYDAQALQEKM